MRDAYHEQLDSVGHTLVEIAELVGQALSRATRALLLPDLPVAEAVISADDAVDALHRELDVRTLDLMARQQPVAGDLRTLVTSLGMSADLDQPLLRGLTHFAAENNAKDPTVDHACDQG